MSMSRNPSRRFGISRVNKRAVSPIIATILLVAITVVLAAVLYILITGLTTSSSKPYSLGIGATGTPGTSANSAVFYDNFSFSPTSGLTTSLFGLKITSASNSPVSPAAVPAACVIGASATVTPCIEATAGSTAWYVVLVNSNGNVLATYPTTAASTSWNGGTVNLAASDSLVIISGAALAGTGDTFSAFGTGSSTVTGSVTM